MNQKKLIIKLLDAQREAHIRHCRIADHLAAHFHVNYAVFEADPLLRLPNPSSPMSFTTGVC